MYCVCTLLLRALKRLKSPGAVNLAVAENHSRGSFFPPNGGAEKLCPVLRRISKVKKKGLLWLFLSLSLSLSFSLSAISVSQNPSAREACLLFLPLLTRHFTLFPQLNSKFQVCLCHYFSHSLDTLYLTCSINCTCTFYSLCYILQEPPRGAMN